MRAKKEYSEKERKRLKIMVCLTSIIGIIGTPFGFFFLEIVPKGEWVRFFVHLLIITGITAIVVALVFEALYIILFKRIEWF